MSVPSPPLCGSVHPETGATCTVPIHNPLHGHHVKPVGRWPASDAELAEWGETRDPYHALHCVCGGDGAPLPPDLRAEKLAIWLTRQHGTVDDHREAATQVLEMVTAAGLTVLDQRSPELRTRLGKWIRRYAAPTPDGPLMPDEAEHLVVDLLAILAAPPGGQT